MLNIGITSVGSGIGQAVKVALRHSVLPLRIVGFEAHPWAKGSYERRVMGQSGCAFYEHVLSLSVGVSRFEQVFERVIAHRS